jgi:type II restriction enzyme
VHYSAANLVKAILGLPQNRWYEYISSTTRTQVQVVRSDGPEGPITIARRDPTRNSSPTEASISTQMIWRVANAIAEGVPLHFDRILGASYNTRSAFEALLAHTSEFYYCRPGRIELIHNSTKILRGHKHLIWLPSKPHRNGAKAEYEVGTNLAISEIPSQIITYETLTVKTSNHQLDIDLQRRHAQIQVALAKIGACLGFRTWIAHGDRGIKYGNSTIGQLPGVVQNLRDERVLTAYNDAIDAALHIDCIWFRNGKFMPAVMEIEHTTGVTSGLARLKRFQDAAPALANIRWVIVAPDEDRNNVIRKASTPQFRSLDIEYFSYSSVEELHSLCMRRRIDNLAVNDRFISCFMERVNQSVAP